MRRSFLPIVAIVFAIGVAGFAQQTSSSAPYKVLKSARVGGEGGWDYIFADTDGRRLYIPRGATRSAPGSDLAAVPSAAVARIAVFDLDSLNPVGEIPDTGGNGVAVCPHTTHGFASSHPSLSMFDTATLKLIKKIDVTQGFQADGIYCDAFNNRVYVFSHPTKSAMVIDAKGGAVIGSIDLGGTPEQGVADGRGTLYVVMQAESNVAVVDVKTMTTTAHYDFAQKGGRCNGLALDAKNRVLFVACANASMTPAPGEPPQPTMVVMSTVDGKILATLPLAGGSDGALFNPSTLEAFSTQGNGTLTVVKETSSTSFEVEQNLQTMNGARTIAFDAKTNHVLTMSQEFGPAPATPPPGGRGGGRGPAVPGSFTILMIGK